MAKFSNVEVYVRVTNYGAYEGEEVRFATVDEEQATTYFSNDSDGIEGDYAPDTSMEQLRIFLNGRHQETWYRQEGEWVTPQHGVNKRKYGVIVAEERS